MDFILGGSETGAALIDQVDLICFTGSVATGRKVAMAAAGNFIPAFLELGGKDPVIVLGDADLHRATDAVLRGGILNSGQVCLSIERVYVQDSMHNAFVDRLVAKAQAVTLNYPDIRRGEIGPPDPGVSGAAHRSPACGCTGAGRLGALRRRSRKPGRRTLAQANGAHGGDPEHAGHA